MVAEVVDGTMRWSAQADAVLDLVRTERCDVILSGPFGVGRRRMVWQVADRAGGATVTIDRGTVAARVDVGDGQVRHVVATGATGTHVASDAVRWVVQRPTIEDIDAWAYRRGITADAVALSRDADGRWLFVELQAEGEVRYSALAILRSEVQRLGGPEAWELLRAVSLISAPRSLDDLSMVTTRSIEGLRSGLDALRSLELARVGGDAIELVVAALVGHDLGEPVSAVMLLRRAAQQGWPTLASAALELAASPPSDSSAPGMIEAWLEARELEGDLDALRHRAAISQRRVATGLPAHDELAVKGVRARLDVWDGVSTGERGLGPGPSWAVRAAELLDGRGIIDLTEIDGPGRGRVDLAGAFARVVNGRRAGEDTWGNDVAGAWCAVRDCVVAIDALWRGDHEAAHAMSARLGDLPLAADVRSLVAAELAAAAPPAAEPTRRVLRPMWARCARRPTTDRPLLELPLEWRAHALTGAVTADFAIAAIADALAGGVPWLAVDVLDVALATSPADVAAVIDHLDARAVDSAMIRTGAAVRRVLAVRRIALTDVLRTWRLTPAEVDVMRLVADGRSNAAIAQAMEISLKTVHSHVQRLYAKVGVSSRVTLGAEFARTR